MAGITDVMILDGVDETWVDGSKDEGVGGALVALLKIGERVPLGVMVLPPGPRMGITPTGSGSESSKPGSPTSTSSSPLI